MDRRLRSLFLHLALRPQKDLTNALERKGRVFTMEQEVFLQNAEFLCEVKQLVLPITLF